MSKLRQIIDTGLHVAKAANPKMTPYGIAKLYGTSHPNLKDAIEGGRGFSDEMLTALGKCPEFPYSYNQLKGYQAIEEYGEEAIYEAFKALYPEKAAQLVSEQKEKARQI